MFVDQESSTFFQATEDALAACMASHSNDPHYVEVAKAAKCAEIDAFRDSKLFAGIPYTGGPIVSEKLFEASRVKRTDLNSVIATGKDEQDALDDEGQGEIYIHPWWDIDENQYDFTIAEFKHFRRSLSQFVSPIYGAGKWHKAVVEHTLTTVAEVEAYDFSAGWPV